MRFVSVLDRLNIVLLLHSAPAPHNEWLPMITPLAGLVILGVMGLVLYYLLKNSHDAPEGTDKR